MTTGSLHPENLRPENLRPENLRLAVFDCDGTLVDSQSNIVLALQNTFTARGLPTPTAEAIRHVVGLSLEEAMRALVPDASHTATLELAESYRATFRRLREETRLAAEPLFPGIKELLLDLSRKNWLLAVATGKSSRGLRLVLEQHDIAHLFLALETADHYPSKPHPAMLEAAMQSAGVAADRTVMIGDTTYDIIMARGAGVKAIGVGWGYHSPEALRAAGASRIAQSVEELRELVDET